jgi:hypothetical protein
MATRAERRAVRRVYARGVQESGGTRPSADQGSIPISRELANKLSASPRLEPIIRPVGWIPFTAGLLFDMARRGLGPPVHNVCVVEDRRVPR